MNVNYAVSGTPGTTYRFSRTSRGADSWLGFRKQSAEVGPFGLPHRSRKVRMSRHIETQQCNVRHGSVKTSFVKSDFDFWRRLPKGRYKKLIGGRGRLCSTAVLGTRSLRNRALVRLTLGLY
jgi:hypothetical protein